LRHHRLRTKKASLLTIYRKCADKLVASGFRDRRKL
jgi:hypothetical protein